MPEVKVSSACPKCGRFTVPEQLRDTFYVCECGHHHRPTSEFWIALLADPGTWRARWEELRPMDFLGWQEPVPYDDVIERRRAQGHDESVRAGFCTMAGHRVCLAVFDFAFLGGTLGVVAGERLARAMECAASARIPVVVVYASGGARMQEGALALMQMAKVNSTVRLLQDAAVPHISILTDPTFGGTSASLALIADLVLAEPGSAIGFTGARVIEQATFARLPPDFQTAEFQLAHGQIDMVVPRSRLRLRVVELLDLHLARPRPRRPPPPRPAPPPAPARRGSSSGWTAVQIARHADRPYAGDYLHRWADRFLELHGDRVHGDDPAVVGGLAEWRGTTTMFLGQQKARTLAERVRRNFGMMHPEGFRKAIRLARHAARFGFPIVVLVDTPGAFPGAGAEEGGIAGAIGSAIAEWFRIDTPVLAAVIGEGGSGGALGMCIADRVLMLEHAIYSVASPEAAASIVWRDSSKKAVAAEQLHLTAGDMLRLGVVDAIVPEPPGGAHLDHDAAARLLGEALWTALGEASGVPAHERLGRRRQRYREMGSQALDGGHALLAQRE